MANLGQRPKEKSISKNKRCKRGSIAALASIAQHRARRIQRRACDWGVARRMIEAVRAVNRAFSAGASGVSPNPGALPQAPAECCAVGAKQISSQRVFLALRRRTREFPVTPHSSHPLELA